MANEKIDYTCGFNDALMLLLIVERLGDWEKGLEEFDFGTTLSNKAVKMNLARIKEKWNLLIEQKKNILTGGKNGTEQT